MAQLEHANWVTGDAYEQYMGRWSRRMAPVFVRWLNVGSSLTWLDVGCGTGALSGAVTSANEPLFIAGLDPSISFIHFARQQNPLPAFGIADGSSLPLQDRGFDVVVSGLALNFMPDSERAIAEMHRVVKPGGTVAAYVWDYAGKMEFLRYFWDAAKKLNPAAQALDQAERFTICNPDALSGLWQRAGFKDVSVEALDIPTEFRDFEDYWQPFTLGNFPAPKYVASLDEAHRDKLREQLRETLCEVDGSINLIARAWAVRGYR